MMNSASTYPHKMSIQGSSLPIIKRHQFNAEAMSSLSLFDQGLFQAFAQGPRQSVDYQCIHQAIEHWARVQPNAIAAEQGNEKISYQQLDSRANNLALQLLQQGAQPGQYIGLFVKRSLHMLVGMLAVMKTGAAYVPLDISISVEKQLLQVIDIAQLTCILTLSQFQYKIPIKHNLACLYLDTQQFPEKQQPLAALTRVSHSSDNCCFVLFTSGTTGVPNGVKVSHGNLTNILLTEPGNLAMKPGVKVSQILNIAFDMSAWEILGALANGASLVIRQKDIQAAVAKADIIIATPSILNNLSLAQVLPVQRVAVAGEPCPRTLADRWSKHCEFYNSCGPTETTIINTACRHFAESNKISIGAPTPNNTVYILDENLQPCAIGEVGEMWAGGAGVTQGYLNNSSLTEQRYQADPFLGGKHRMFRTRDLAFWHKDGLLEHIGRSDDQVKIRGFRVELDAISHALEHQPDCTRAITLKLNCRQLIAFVMPVNVDIATARQALTKQLPYYCIPGKIYSMDSLPLTDRGKIDKQRLYQQYIVTAKVQEIA